MIQPKLKKCKGTGVAKGYGCGDLNIKRVYGLGLKCRCYQDWLFESEEGKKKVAKATLKATKVRTEYYKAKELNNVVMSGKSKMSYVKTLVHKAVRLRDQYKPCVSCGKSWNSEFQAGHYFKAELYNTIKLHFDNIHGQCVQCNIHEEGNLNEYALRLPNRIGEDKFKQLNELA